MIRIMVPMVLFMAASLAVPAGGLRAEGSSAGSGEGAPAAAVVPGGQAADADYCRNIADEAAEARMAWQMKALQDLKVELESKTAELEQKRAEYEEWLKRRDAELKDAEVGLVQIYEGMRNDAAAQQLALLDVRLSTAILRRLKSRKASAILNEMDPAKAAQLTKALSRLPGVAKSGS